MARPNKHLLMRPLLYFYTKARALTFPAIKVFMACSTCLYASSSIAGSLYLPLNIAPEIESRIEKLFVLANIPINKRPIPIKHIHRAIEKTELKHPALTRSVKQYLERYDKTLSVTHLSAAATATNSGRYAHPNQRGSNTEQQYSVSIQAFYAVNDFIAINIGGMTSDQTPYDNKNTYPEGSFLSFGNDSLQVDIGYRPHWFGPFQESDMLISTQATSLPSITLSNIGALSFLNIYYEVFLGEMSETDQILSQDSINGDDHVYLQGKPLLFGTHLSLQPFGGFSLGFNRLMQFGGADRTQAPKDVFNAFFNVKESENTGAGGNDFGNQLSSITTRYTFADDFPVSIYMTYAGEDTSGASDIHFTNSALMMGIHLPQIGKYLDFSAEFAEWQNGWYTNGNYPSDGLRHHGSVLGHWGGNQRVFSDAVGATASTYKLIWDLPFGNELTLKLRNIENRFTSEQDYQASQIITADYAHGIGSYIVGLSFLSGNTVFGDDIHQLSGFVRW